jgi:hypothetical protein
VPGADQYLVSARELLPSLTEERLAKILKRIDEISAQRDREHHDSALVISALVELLGGEAFLPRHALQNAPGYEAHPGSSAGDLLLRSASR